VIVTRDQSIFSLENAPFMASGVLSDNEGGCATGSGRDRNDRFSFGVYWLADD